jgi:hypothetical protein
MEASMDNRVGEIRKQIRALRVTMLEAEDIMRGQIAQDQDCSFVAGEIHKMRTVMSRLAAEKASLGDREPILVNSHSVPRRPATPKPEFTRPAKRHLAPAHERVG